MPLDGITEGRQQLRGLFRRRRIVTGRRVGRHAHDLAQKFNLLRVVLVDPAVETCDLLCVQGHDRQYNGSALTILRERASSPTASF